MLQPKQAVLEAEDILLPKCEITLVLKSVSEDCKPTIINNEIEYPNCKDIWKYKFEVENGNITITSINNTIETIILNKEA